MQIIETLTQIGLSEKQAATYIALLELSPTTALDLSRKSGIKRPTTYVILDELIELGLVTSIAESSTTIFTAQPPETIEEILNEKYSAFHSIKATLENLHTTEGQTPKVRMYSGIEDIKKLYKRIFAENERIDFFGVNIEAFYNSINTDFAEFLINEIDCGKNQVRDLLHLNEFNYNWASKNTGDFHKIRLVDPKHQFFGDNAIYGNTLMIASLNEPFAMTIESKEVANTYRSLFNISWSAAKHPQDIAQKNVPRGTNDIGFE